MTSCLADSEAWLVLAITGEESDAAGVDGHLTGSSRMTPRERLEIYRSGYRSRLVECLEDDYPALAASLGQERFESLCHGYMDRHPSRTPNLNDFGRHMEAFAREVNLSPFVVELARLEWTLVEMIHAPSPPRFDFSTLREIPPEAWADVRFTPSPAARLVHFEHPVNEWYQAWRAGDAPPPPPQASPSATLVYRREFRLWRMDLRPVMARVLGALVAGVPLGEALTVLEAPEVDPADAQRAVTVWLRDWVDGGIFAGAAAPGV